MQALAIMYHDVVENGDFESSGFPGEGAHVYKLRRQDFEHHLEAIAGATSAVGTVNQLEGRPVLLTFDDGGSSFHHPIADLLEGRGWRGHFFITTDRIGTAGFLTEAQLRELHRRGHIIGSHSCSHPTRMAALSRAELDREWRQSIARLSAVLGDAVKVASVPGGYYSREVGESAACRRNRSLVHLRAHSAGGDAERLPRARPLRGAARDGARSGPPVSPPAVLRNAGDRRALWKAKRVAKSLGGGKYLQLRRAILERKG